MSYIVPMKKPICINCPFRSLDSCTLIYLMSDKDSEVTVHVNEMTVSPDCPLAEIPTPHGRLGDLDKLKADHSMKNDCAECEKELQGSSRACEYDRIYSKMDFCQWIDNAETVIEAGGRA